VEECPCSSNSIINGRWIGEFKDSNNYVYLNVNLTANYSDLSGNGTLNLQLGNFDFENLVSLSGSFVSNKIVFKINEIDRLSFEGSLNERKDTIIGSMFFRDHKFPLSLKRI
jgi:hypothetical protein